MTTRTRAGRFAKGYSGNPAGRPRVVAEVREAAKAHSENAIATLAEIMTDPGQPAGARVAAANAILDRAWGKPTLDTKLPPSNRDPSDYSDAELVAMIEPAAAVEH